MSRSANRKQPGHLTVTRSSTVRGIASDELAGDSSASSMRRMHPYRAPFEDRAEYPVLHGLGDDDDRNDAGGRHDASYLPPRGINRPINPAASRSNDREKTGCNTCRLRGKKCPDPIVDGEVPSHPCRNCSNPRHAIQCLGYGSPTDGYKLAKWLSQSEPAMKAQLKVYNLRRLHDSEDYLKFHLVLAPEGWEPYFGDGITIDDAVSLEPSPSFASDSDSSPTQSPSSPVTPFIPPSLHSFDLASASHLNVSPEISSIPDARTFPPPATAFNNTTALYNAEPSAHHAFLHIDPALLRLPKMPPSYSSQPLEFAEPDVGSLPFDAGEIEPHGLGFPHPLVSFALANDFLNLIGEGEWPNIGLDTAGNGEWDFLSS